MFEGDRIRRLELFDEADTDAAIARFEELSRPVPRLENAASQAGERCLAFLTTRDWAAMHDCAGFVKKPVDEQALLDEIRSVLSVKARVVEPAQP